MVYAAEVRMATGYLLNQVYGARYGNPATLNPPPCWCNFEFFSEIRPGKIIHYERLAPGESQGRGWKVVRVVEYYHRGKLVAEVGLIGMEFDRMRDHKPLPMWAIDRIRYAARFDRSEPEDWREEPILSPYVSAA